MMAGTPQPFPQPTLNTQRALCAIEMSHPDKLGDCFAALYQKFWVEGKTIGKPEVFGPVLIQVLGEKDGKAILEKVGSPEVKKRLTDNSDWAFDEGAFGLPWFVATNSKGESSPILFLILETVREILTALCIGEKESFWGVDHIGQVVEHLGLPRKDEPGYRAML